MDSRWRWTPEYTVETKAGKKPYYVEGVEAPECPVSFISQESIQLVTLFATARSAHDASGASLFGPDLSQWDARMVDAQGVVERCRTEEYAARMKALDS